MKGNLEALEILEDGMYVRTNEGIDKFEYKHKHDEYDFYIYKFQKRSMSNPEYYIIGKPSFNLIDLIEVGDYVNGSKVIETDNCKGAMREIYLEGQNPEEDCGLYFEEIKSIVTKEQFSSMEYKL